MTLGLLILLFVAYQLWGTGIFTARAQASLEDDFEAAQDAYAAVETTTTLPADDPTLPGPDTTTPTTAARTFAAELPPLVEGEQAGHILIPKIGSTRYFVEGTSRQDLKKGPGHYPGTPMPGQIGNAAIAGHRTTYGAAVLSPRRARAGRRDHHHDLGRRVHLQGARRAVSRGARADRSRRRTHRTSASSRSRPATRSSRLGSA